MHYSFDLLGILPSAEQIHRVTDRDFFRLDYTFWLNLAFLLLSIVFLGWKIARFGLRLTPGDGVIESALLYLAILSYLWLAGGLAVGWLGAGA